MTRNKHDATNPLKLEPRFERRRIEELKPAAYNPRTIKKLAKDGLSRSIDEFGLVEPLVWNERTGNLVGGHQRYNELKRRGIEETIVSVVDLSEDEEKLLNISLNNPNIQGHFTWRVGDIIRESERSPDLMSDLQFSRLLNIKPVKMRGDKKPKPNTYKIQVGDRVILDSKLQEGDHIHLRNGTIICGNSHDDEFIDNELRDKQPETLVLDPPYELVNRPMMPECDHVLVFTDGNGKWIADALHRFGTEPKWVFIWDQKTSLASTFSLTPRQRSQICFWFGNKTYDPRGSMHLVGKEEKQLQDVYSAETMTQLLKLTGHSHAKPLDWIRMLIANCTKGTVLDPYAGSGSAWIACAQLNRRYVGFELDPGTICQAYDYAKQLGMEPRIERTNG